MKLAWALGCISVFAATPARAQGILGGIVDVIVDGGNDFAWEKVELPGTVCGDGSQYKFFVSRTGSQNVLFYFEGGGACWDYDTCSGRAGLLGASNPNGIADDYMTQFRAQYASPVMNGADPGIPFRSRTDLVTAGWNVVFLPYCTGDVHVGNNTAVYDDTTGVEPPLQWHHAGFSNTLAAASYVQQQFPSIAKLLVSGYSAGGTATAAAYYFVRRTLGPAQGYYFNDSGPVHLAPNVDNRSRPLHDKIRQSWSLDSVFAQLPTTFDVADFGSVNGMVAREFPNDRLAYSGYNRDYTYSRFSYERFLTPNDKESVLAYWKEDQDALLASLEQYPNFSYFVPHARPINDGHCTSVITFIGSHACQAMEKKRKWYEYLEWPPGQSYKCYSEFVPMETFLERFVAEDQLIRIHEPANGYNDQDPGMSIVAPIINAALEGLVRVTVIALVLAAVACRDRGVNRLMGTGEPTKPVAMTDGDWLREAVRAGNRDIVDALLRTGADAAAPDKLGLTPLAIAARHTDDVSLARTLLNAAPITLESTDSLQRTPLSWACGEGHKNVCAFLLTQKAATAARDTTGKTPLFHAVLRGQLETAALLIANHADPDSRDNFGDTPLMMAASKNNAAMVDVLLRAGADAAVKDDQGRTPLARAQSPDVRRLLSGNAEP